MQRQNALSIDPTPFTFPNEQLSLYHHQISYKSSSLILIFFLLWVMHVLIKMMDLSKLDSALLSLLEPHFVSIFNYINNNNNNDSEVTYLFQIKKFLSNVVFPWRRNDTHRIHSRSTHQQYEEDSMNEVDPDMIHEESSRTFERCAPSPNGSSSFFLSSYRLSLVRIFLQALLGYCTLIGHVRVVIPTHTMATMTSNNRDMKSIKGNIKLDADDDELKYSSSATAASVTRTVALVDGIQTPAMQLMGVTLQPCTPPTSTSPLSTLAPSHTTTNAAVAAWQDKQNKIRTYLFISTVLPTCYYLLCQLHDQYHNSDTATYTSRRYHRKKTTATTTQKRKRALQIRQNVTSFLVSMIHHTVPKIQLYFYVRFLYYGYGPTSPLLYISQLQYQKSTNTIQQEQQEDTYEDSNTSILNPRYFYNTSFLHRRVMYDPIVQWIQYFYKTILSTTTTSRRSSRAARYDEGRIMTWSDYTFIHKILFRYWKWFLYRWNHSMNRYKRKKKQLLSFMVIYLFTLFMFPLFFYYFIQHVYIEDRFMDHLFIIILYHHSNDSKMM